jgi:hypothetical protein
MKLRKNVVFPAIVIKKSQADRALEFLTSFVERNRTAVTSDDPIDGADCVECFCQLWYDAEKITKGAKT